MQTSTGVRATLPELIHARHVLNVLEVALQDDIRQHADSGDIHACDILHGQVGDVARVRELLEVRANGKSTLEV